MIYKGFFRDINDLLYEVRIITDYTHSYGVMGSIGDEPSYEEVTLGGEPFVTSMNEDGETIYSPIKCQGATVSLILNSHKPDIFAKEPHGTKIELISNDKILFTGYVTPNLYSQGWDKSREIMEIECLDGLASLQYIPYESVEEGKKTTISFRNLLTKILHKCDCYTNFYFPTNIRAYDEVGNRILEDLFISEWNFFKDKNKGELKEESWKYRDVLEEVCRYLNVSCVAEGTSVYFIDYDGIKNGYYEYAEYDVSNGAFVRRTNISAHKVITSQDFSATGSRLSLDNVYNQISVSADINEIQTDMTDVLDGLDEASTTTLMNPNDNPTLWERYQSELADGQTFSGIYNGLYYIRDFRRDGDRYAMDDPKAVWMKFYLKSNPVEVYTYNYPYDNRLVNFARNWENMCKYKGATMVKFCHQPIEFEGGDEIGLINGKLSLTDTFVMNIKNTGLDDKPYYDLKGKKHNNISIDGSNPTKPFITYRDTVKMPKSVSPRYLTIDFDAIYHNYLSQPYFREGEYRKDGGYADKDKAFIWATLKVGKYYITGRGRDWAFNSNYMGDTDDFYDWTTSAPVSGDLHSRLRIYYDVEDDEKINGKSIKPVSNIQWGMNIDGDGIAFKIPEDVELGDGVEFSIYAPHSITNGVHHFAFINNLQLGMEVDNLANLAKDDNSDTEYRMEIDDSFAEELSEITCRINTYDGKKVNKSTVYTNKGALGDIYNKALEDEELGTAFIGGAITVDDNYYGLRPEWWICYRHYKQYSTPSIVLEMNLRNDLHIYNTCQSSIDMSKTFIIDTISRDYQKNRSLVKLIEKK